MKSSNKSDLGATTSIKVVAITGSSGSGKSTVADFFKEFGAIIIDADQLARDVVKPESPGLKQIADQFGTDFIDETGHLKRKKLGELVFADQQKLKKLEAILHPLIKISYQAALKDALVQKPPLIVYCVPLYFEAGIKYPEIRAVIVVDSDPNLCVDRIVKRDNITKDVALARLSKQIDGAKKASMADYVIKNNSGLNELKAAALNIYQAITMKS